MLDDTRYSDEDILSEINLLKKFKLKKYNNNILNNAIYNLPIEDKEKKLSLKKIFSKSNVDNVLIIGPGKNLKLYKKEIIKFIKKFKPLVLSINYNHIIEKKYINYFCSCNIGRFMMDIGDYIDAKKPLIFPNVLLFEKNQYLKELNIYNFGVSFKKNQFKINEKDCILPDNLSFLFIRYSHKCK